METPSQSRIAVALEHLTLPDKDVFDHIGTLLDRAGFRCVQGKRILVKPNLLLADSLACTDPLVVAALCAWLLDNGAKVFVSDSPGFGTANSVARAIGLTDALARLGLELVPHGRTVWKRATVQGKSVRIPLAELALSCDRIVSVPRIKVHKQMLLSLAVKNCFGCIPGLHKAVVHTLYGASRSFFSEYIAALYGLLPPVAALADGTVAMDGTGPSGGRRYPLGLVGACDSAETLDRVLSQILGVDPANLPLSRALVQRKALLCQASPEPAGVFFPLESPSAWHVADFRLPELITTSFAPHRLLVSCVRRLLASRF